MLSFLALDIYNVMVVNEVMQGANCHRMMSRIDITTRGPSSGNLTIGVCGHDPPAEKVYHASVIFVRFFSDWDKSRGTGFRLVYSVHQQGQTPERLANGLWNCSVPFWASVKIHFQCDLAKECAEGEDERDCPYSNPLCARGEFFLGHSCYTYGKVEPMSWKSASLQCQNRGAQLVSLNDVDEWRSVTGMLRQFDVVDVYTGLRDASPALPMM